MQANRRSADIHNKYSIDRIDSDDSVTESINHQILRVENLNRNVGGHYCNDNVDGFDLIRKCRGCGQEMTMNDNQSLANETCNCGKTRWMWNENGSVHSNDDQDTTKIRRQSQHIADTNEASTSTSNYTNRSCDINGNRRHDLDVDDEANGNTNAVGLDSITDNGIIRLDMSQIIDRTGLPTYEAALKLESSGYV